MSAYGLGAEVIAEGVETPWQREVLASTRCDCGQGYLFAKPMITERLETLLIG